MKYYKHTKTGEVYAYDQEQVDGSWVKDGLVSMTVNEVHVHLNPIPTTKQLASSARHERDKALRVLDAVVSNPLRFGDLLEEQRLEAATYRKLLLDIPQQEGFPITYEMPKAPSWLT